MAQLNEMMESLKALETNCRLSYLGPQDGHNEEEGVDATEGTYTKDNFLKKAKHNLKQLFNFVYRHQMHIIGLYNNLHQEHKEVAAEQAGLKKECDALKAEYKKARKDLEQLQGQHRELEADCDMFRDAFAITQVCAGSEPASVVITAINRVTTTPRSIKLPKGSKLLDGVEPIFKS